MKCDILKCFKFGDDIKDVDDEDYIAKAIGPFGVWQFIMCTTVTLVRYIAIWNMMAIAFLTPTTDFRCIELEGNSSTGLLENSTCYDDCAKYEYYSDVMNTSLISDFGLICEDSWLASFTQSVIMFGILIGVSLFGWISDRYGRRIALVSSTVINAIFMIATPFATDYWTFTFLRFITGLGSGGGIVVSIVFVMEIVGKQYREIAGSIAIQPDGIAASLLAVFAYFFPTWTGYTMGYAVASVVIMVLIFFVPESPRWMVANGKTKDAIDLMITAARLNKLEINHITSDINKIAEDLKLIENEATKTSYLDLFRTKQLIINTIGIFIIWLIAGICFCGVYQYVTYFDVNVHLLVASLGILQVLISPLAIIVNKIFGRKKSVIGTMVLTGASMIIPYFLPEGHISGTILAIIGYNSVNAAYSIIYVYVSELFPTQLRTMGYGLATGGAKFGGMIAPFIANTTPMWIPTLIFGVLPFVAALTCVMLPETKGFHFKDTIEND